MISLKGKKVALDSMILIYLFEGNAFYSKTIQRLMREIDQVILSTFLLGEVTAGLYRSGNTELAERFFDFVHANPNIKLHAFDLNAAMRFSELRVKSKFSAPDCIHLATALESKADYFLTNDKRLKSFREIKVIQLEDLI